MLTSAPWGFQPAYHPTGLERAAPYPVASTYGTSIYKYDPVILNTNGTVTIGTAAADLLGVFDGVQYTDTTGKPCYSNFWPAGTTATDIQAFVWTDPGIVYVVQADGSLAAASVGDQSDCSNISGSTVTGLSTTTLSASLAGAGNQGQWRILGLYQNPYNAWGDAYTAVYVQLARSQYVANKVAI